MFFKKNLVITLAILLIFIVTCSKKNDDLDKAVKSGVAKTESDSNISSAQKKSLTKDYSKVEIPKISEKCMNEFCVEDQFVQMNEKPEYNEAFVLTAGDNVNLRTKPSVDASVVEKLPKAKRVTVIYAEKDKIVINGQEGRWVFVMRETSLKSLKNSLNDPKYLKGWIFDSFLGYKSKFIKTDKWNFKKIEYSIGDYGPAYYCAQDGKFRTTYDETDDSYKVIFSFPVEGDICVYNSLVWFRSDEKTLALYKKYNKIEWFTFMYLDDDKIKHENQYSSENESIKVENF